MAKFIYCGKVIDIPGADVADDVIIEHGGPHEIDVFVSSEKSYPERKQIDTFYIDVMIEERVRDKLKGVV